MFVTLVEPQDQGDPIETLGILVNRNDDGARGTILVINRLGAMHARANVPFEGQHVEGGVHIKLAAPPSYLEEQTETPPVEDNPPADETPPEETPPDTYTVGS